MSHTDKQRADIQVLRGWAVVLVVVYHANLGGLGAGYLGVDVFFVVSGFLITSLVARGIQRGDFSLPDFYFRRAKRLLPAAYVVFGCAALLSPWLLNQQELHDFIWQVLGAVTFTANVILWQQTGYFDGASELKPLLHTWSLALEEQYYLLLPALLLLLRQRRWLSVLAVTAIGSFALCLWTVAHMPSAAFYLLPTRAWELLIGSLGALIVLRSDQMSNPQTAPWIRAVNWLYMPSIGCLMLVPVFSFGGPHPGLGALAVCVATLVVILRRDTNLGTRRPARWLADVGDYSYSLYLVHWPVLALLRNAYVGPGADMPTEVRLGAVVLSFAFAYALFRFVEDPVRRTYVKPSGRLLVGCAAASLAVLAIAPIGAIAMKSDTNFAHLLRTNYGLSERCEYQSPFVPRSECESGRGTEVLVWGDSYAMHLVPGLAAQRTPELRIVQATKSGCGPVVGVGPERPVHPGTGLVYDRAWALSCMEFNDSVLSYVASRPDLQVVVLSSPLVQYVDPEWVHHRGQGGETAVKLPSVHDSSEAILNTVGAIRQMGKRVIWFAPPPSTGLNMAACLQRELSRKWSWGGSEDCAISRDTYEAKRRDVIALLDAIETKGVPVVRFDDVLCDASRCKTLIDGVMVYRDQGHFSGDGAILLSDRMQWLKLIAERSR